MAWWASLRGRRREGGSARNTLASAACAAGVALIFLGLLAAEARAASPHWKLSEVYPGSTASPLAEFVELQSMAPGQADVDGRVLRFYDATGTPVHSLTLPTDVPNGSSQRTILFGSAEASPITGVVDFALPSSDLMAPGGGAVCFTGEADDCVAWGSFGALATLPDPQWVPPAHPIADESSLRRILTRGCPTFLDPADDSDNSRADFEVSVPQPRRNSSPTSELPCVPNTFITIFPANPTRETSATFHYTESPQDPAIRFECAVDWADSLGDEDFAPCPEEGLALAGLVDGEHRVAVRAVGQGGTDPTAASRAWTVDTVPPQTTIASTPPSPSWGVAASYTYVSSEPDSGFHCRLDGEPIQVCTEFGRSFFALADGPHTFQVWATDNAGNKDPTPAIHTFIVDNRIGDKTPPDTEMVTGPPDPSGSPAASFSYVASEPGSSFECRLGTGRFTSCPGGGTSYERLRNDIYAFQVRATDRAGNTDSTPASFKWRVAAPTPNTRFKRVPPGNVAAKGRNTVPVLFGFEAPRAASFRCRLDLTAEFRPCRSPHRLRARPGRHIFQVLAVDRLGNRESVPAFRIFRVQAPGRHQAAFFQSGRFLSSLTAWISPEALPRHSFRPVALRFASAFENLDGSDIPVPRAMTMRLAPGGAVQWRGLPRCRQRRIEQRSSREALSRCRAALVGRGAVQTAVRFPEGERIRSQAQLLLFNAGPRILMHIYVKKPLSGVFVVPISIRRLDSGGTVLRARFPRVAAGHGHLTGFWMQLERSYRYRGERRSYLLGRCAAPRGLDRVAFELARVVYRFEGGLRLENSTVNTCRVRG